MKRLGHIGDAISQLLNVALLPDSSDTDANESISGRCYRRGWRRSERAINFFFGPDHCHRAFKKDVARARRLLEQHDSIMSRDLKKVVRIR